VFFGVKTDGQGKKKEKNGTVLEKKVAHCNRKWRGCVVNASRPNDGKKTKKERKAATTG